MSEFEFGSTIKNAVYNVNEYTIYIDDEIQSVSAYRDELHVLSTATESDLVTVRVNSNGGDLGASITLYNAISACQADTTLVLEHEASSGGSIIMMADVKQVTVMPFASMMVHNLSIYGMGGKLTDIESYSAFQRKNINALYKKAYKNFLTDQELNDVLNHGAELYFDSEEIVKRLNNKHNPKPTRNSRKKTEG